MYIPETGFTIDTFSFHMAKEVFTTCIIMKITFLGKGLNSVVYFKYLAKCKSGILRSLVGMKQYILKFISIEISLFKSFHSQVHIMAIRNIPADDFP